MANDRNDILINKPHALYYNGELIGIITNPDPQGTIDDLCGSFDHHGGQVKAVAIQNNIMTGRKWDHLTQILEKLGVAGVVEDAVEDDVEDDVEDVVID